jgi:predicted membrane channel-forming protein YqfA (hemolysin III family)
MIDEGGIMLKNNKEIILFAIFLLLIYKPLTSYTGNIYTPVWLALMLIGIIGARSSSASHSFWFFVFLGLIAYSVCAVLYPIFAPVF